LVKDPKRLEKAVIKIAIVPLQTDEKGAKSKRGKTRVKFDLNGYGTYTPSNVIGGFLADEPTMTVKIIQEKDFVTAPKDFNP
jgi:3,4-dihydroxy-2-butanone 4-phosphate synthase